MQPIESSMLPLVPQHMHEGPADKPCTKCGMSKKNAVHAAFDESPPPDPGTGSPPNGA